jgi:hypothetical protein
MSSLGRPRQSFAWSARSLMSGPALGIGLALIAAGPVCAAAGGETSTEAETRLPPDAVPELTAGAPRVFKICHDQTYALCAVASCYVFNLVAYCKCDIKHGDSISLPLEANGQDVCGVNAAGPANGYMVSTFSVADSVLKGGNKALYTCPASKSDGAYAQCDGGLCFTSTKGAPAFPGFDAPLAPGQIMCSCPITVAIPGSAGFGYQIAGPYPCQADYFRNCQSAVTSPRTGSTIPVGAPTGVALTLALLLNGPPVPQLNRCPSPAGAE